MNNQVVNETCRKLFSDGLVRGIVVSVAIFALFTTTYVSALFGLFALFSFGIGCAIPLVLLSHRNTLAKLFDRLKDVCGYSANIEAALTKCDTCDDFECQRHKAQEISREPWKGLLVEKELDEAVDSFYTRILNSFVKSWFSVLSQDEDFVHTLKLGLREATCHLIKKIKTINTAAVITNKLLPIVFDHVEAAERMLASEVAMDKLPNGFIQNDRCIHPAVVNRQAELEYLRAVAKCLIPRIFHNENFDSKIFFSLVRELLACWVLLPLMDVISDPNLINLMIITATNKGSNLKSSKGSGLRVEFLKKFVSISEDKPIGHDDLYLTDPNQLFYFMQFMKKEGAVDVLRFHLDVDSLNKELQDSRVTTDPAKLSTLHKQSIKLLQDYQNLVDENGPALTKATTLPEAHDRIRACLDGKWRKAFHRTPEYFKLVYQSKEIPLIDDNKNLDATGTVSRLGSKLKDVIRGAIDGAPLEATEVPTVWDALSEPQIATVNPTIYYSVAQKLRKERGQNLDSFLMDFMHSLEQSTDVGEDVIELNETKVKHRPNAPGRNLVFGNLFGLGKTFRNVQISSGFSFNVKGPSECFLYIIYKIFHAPVILVRLIFAFICISKRTVDSLICHMIYKLIMLGLYEPRLAVLIRLLESHLFGPKVADASSEELLNRQKQARERIEELRHGTGVLLDTLQSPALNKHLMYCLFDVILAELYPEFEEFEDGLNVK